MNNFFLEQYSKSFLNVINNKQNLEKILKLANILKKIKKKVIIIGNGGSSAIASHFTIDFIKNTNSKCLNLSDHSLITCFANDYGYENCVAKYIEFYGEKGDILIAISSSGKSKNVLNSVKSAKKKFFSKIITLSGFDKKNALRKEGDLNIWVDSKVYNIVENAHQYFLLTCIDLINYKRINLK
jgi:D-sedoheptulose 7-phosphate isomerase